MSHEKSSRKPIPIDVSVKAMAWEHKVSRRVEFSETDMAGIVHFTNFFRYMETVEHSFYRALGFSVILRHLEPPVGLPRVHASCDYKRPLRFEDVVEIHLIVREKKIRTLTYEIRFTRVEPGPSEEVAVGKLVVVCVGRSETGELHSVPLPTSIIEKVQVAPGSPVSWRAPVVPD